MSVLGCLCESYDFVDVFLYLEVKVVFGVLIVWLEVLLFFVNIECVFGMVCVML